MHTCKNRGYLHDTHSGNTTYAVLPCKSWGCPWCSKTILIPRIRQRVAEFLDRSRTSPDHDGYERLYRLVCSKSDWDNTQKRLERSGLDVKTYIHFDMRNVAVIYLLRPFENASELLGCHARDTLYRDVHDVPKQNHCCSASRDMPSLHEYHLPTGKKLLKAPIASPEGLRRAAAAHNVRCSPRPLNPRRDDTSPVTLDTSHLSLEQIQNLILDAFAMTTPEEYEAMRRGYSCKRLSEEAKSFSDGHCPRCDHSLPQHLVLPLLTG